MAWTVHVLRKVEKQIPKLPKGVQQSLALLLREIEETGPVRGNWPNYSKLGTTSHHCHLKKGRPTYVAVWEVRSASIRLVEVTYVGTHERAPY
jgi:mRNA-degrading endonuclease RelE of RelBE toxin-antitoxin system